MQYTNRKKSKKERSKNKDKKEKGTSVEKGERILINYSIRVESD
jgi:hypothetical protein